MSSSSRRGCRVLPTLGSLAVALGALLTPGVTSAQILPRLVLRGEAGGGTMLRDYQRQELGYDSALIQGGVRVGLRLLGPVELQASFGSAYFFADERGAGQLYTVTGGLRLAPKLARAGWLWVDGNAGLAQTDSLSRLGVDVGAGFEFALGRSVGLGPFARSTWVFANADDNPNDAWFWSAGLSLSLHFPEPEAPPPEPPRDADDDGVPDAQDQCPTEPMGTRPDPARAGCPLRDTDGDGVFDLQDQCLAEPMGAHPDPARTGCPARDTDGDGVFDAQDQCPVTPMGPTPDPERAGCPDGDDDSDTVLNHADQCRTVHRGYHPDPARPGCPLPDRDNDSVPDATDACPDVPGAPSPDPRRNGCPGLVRVLGGQIRINRPVFFAYNRDVILPRSRAVLRAVADALRAETGIRRVSIEGHTDDVGGEEFNVDLSRRRANNVMAWLVQNGIEAQRLEARGFGRNRPLVPGTTDAARATNRRVEFHITDPSQGTDPPTGTAPTGTAPTPVPMPAPAPAPATSPAQGRGR